MNLTIRRIIAFYIDAFFVLFILSMLFLFIYFINETIDLSIIGIPLWGYYIVVYFIYYILLEYFLQQTFAKKIVRIKVIFIKKKSFSSILLRTFFRFIPLDAISFLFDTNDNLWHDLVSKTRVVMVQIS